jgi:hypothetical protein
MAGELAAFFGAAETEFEWLVSDFGFVEVSRVTKLGTSGGPLYGSLTWVTKKTFVAVVLECPRPYIDVQFGPLINGTVPDLLDDANRYYLSGLVIVRAHDERRAANLGNNPGLSGRSLRRGLRECAKTLRELAADVLADDRGIFKELSAFGEWQMSQDRAKYLHD